MKKFGRDWDRSSVDWEASRKAGAFVLTSCGCPSHQPSKRRLYAEGRCDDCGWLRRVTRIKFWLNGYEMLVCKECIKPYRGRILK